MAAVDQDRQLDGLGPSDRPSPSAQPEPSSLRSRRILRLCNIAVPAAHALGHELEGAAAADTGRDQFTLTVFDILGHREIARLAATEAPACRHCAIGFALNSLPSTAAFRSANQIGG